jgi:2'-5' RNA ligase
MAEPLPGDGALFIAPPQRVQAKIVPWRRIYDPEHWRLIPPHITVAYPFVRAEDWPAAQPALAECLAAFPPFWITLSELAAFEQPEVVLWLRPDDEGALVRIHVALAELFPTYFPPGPLPFVPHLTLGFFDSVAGLTQARAAIAARLSRLWRPLRFRVAALHYAVCAAGGVWRIHDTAPLAGARRD